MHAERGLSIGKRMEAISVDSAVELLSKKRNTCNHKSHSEKSDVPTRAPYNCGTKMLVIFFER